MRILHITPSYLPATRYGGPIYSVHSLCRALARAGHEVHVYTTDVDGPGRSSVPLLNPVAIDSVNVTYFPTSLGRRLYRSAAMRREMEGKMSGFDVAHLHSVFLWPTTAGAACARRHGVPYVISPRGMLVANLIQRKSRLIKTAWIALFERSNIAAAAAIHATSQIEVDEMQALGIRARRYAVIANGMDLPDRSQQERVDEANCGDATRGRTVLFLGRINWKKGLDLLIPAMADAPGARLLIAGNDEENYRVQLEALAREKGVTDQVSFIGPVLGEAKWQLLRSADVLALTSYSENFGNAVLEAMASGVPVVVTPGVGLAKTVAAHEAGLVVEGTPAAIGEAIRDLLGDQDARRRFGDNGRRVVAERFSWDGIAREMCDLYGLFVQSGVRSRMASALARGPAETRRSS